MNDDTFKLIKKTTELQAVSGFEHQARNFLKEQLTPLVDEVQMDGLGGTFGIRRSKEEDAPRIMLAAHMDEVGFMISRIRDNGLFNVIPLGGWNPNVISAQRFTLQTSKGDYPCISSSIPPHLSRGNGNQSGTPQTENILFDAGFDSKEEAELFGVRPGDTVVPDVETIKMANGKKIVGKAWDNRYGVTVLLEALRELKDVELPNTLIAGANVQEEVGLRGAKGAVHQFRPDAFFAVDCSPANDMNGDKNEFGQLGKGFLLRIQDPGMILLKGMREYLLDTAETNNIPYQYFVSKGGTDAGAAHVQNNGVPSAVIGVCARYIHTHQTLFHIDDYEAAKEMVIQVAKTMDRSTLETIQKNN